MSLPGWYLDPGKAPGRFRYWDGSAWSRETTANPADPPPGPVGVGRVRRVRGPLIAAAALVVVLAVIAAVVLRNLASSPTPVADPGASTSVSDVGPGSATPTSPPAPPTSATGGGPTDGAPTASRPTASRPTAAGGHPCPQGDPTARQAYPRDQRIHSGGLSFPQQPGWQSSQLSRVFSWAYDVNGQQRMVEPERFAMFAVGALSTADGFETPTLAAELVLECTATPRFYAGFTQRTDLDAEPIKVSGHPGWRIRSAIGFRSPTNGFTGDLVEVVVVDVDSPESLAMFWGAVPVDNAPLVSQLNRVTAQLRAD